MQGKWEDEALEDMCHEETKEFEAETLCFKKVEKWLPTQKYRDAGKKWPVPTLVLEIGGEKVEGVKFENDGRFYPGEVLIEVAKTQGVSVYQKKKRSYVMYNTFLSMVNKYLL